MSLKIKIPNLKEILRLGRGSRDSIKRLNELSRILDDRFTKEVEIK